MGRSSRIERKTGETQIVVELDLDGTGEGQRTTGVGFFDHMLDLFARHGGFDLSVQAVGDLQTGSHHTVEDCGICIGKAFDEALADRAGITRYGHAVVPMDEARADCSVDLSGRPYCAVEVPLASGETGGFEHELLDEFMRAFANNSRFTLHLEMVRPGGAHHSIEASFKALARAMRQAVSIDPLVDGVPSTKGSLV